MVESDSIFEEELALSVKDEEGTASKYDAEQKLKIIIDTNILGKNIKLRSSVSY